MRELAKPLDEDNWPLLDYVLEVADSSMTYKSRYFTTLQPAPVLDVLLLDETNPRSLVFQLNHLGDLYAKLPRHVGRDLKNYQARSGADGRCGLNEACLFGAGRDGI